jgi:hypothetical protein
LSEESDDFFDPALFVSEVFVSEVFVSEGFESEDVVSEVFVSEDSFFGAASFLPSSDHLAGLDR